MSTETELTQNLIITACNNIDSKTEIEIKTDMKQFISALIEFVGVEEGGILDPNSPDDEKGKMFFKMITGIIADSMTAKVHPPTARRLEARFAKLTEMLPVLQAYSSTPL